MRLGQAFPSTVERTVDALTVFEKLKAESSAIPEGATEYIPNEWEDDDKYAALLAASGNGWYDQEFPDEADTDDAQESEDTVA